VISSFISITNIKFYFSDQAKVLYYPRDNYHYALSGIQDKDEPSSGFQYAGQLAISVRFGSSKSICPQHHFYENDNFLHHNISYMSQIFLISLPKNIFLQTDLRN